MRAIASPGWLGLAVTAAAALACAHGPVTSGEGAGAREPWPEELRLDGRVLVVPDVEAETALLDPRPARFVPDTTIYATAAAELMRDSALEIFGGLFRGGAVSAAEPAKREGVRAVVSPYARSVLGTGLAISISATVQLLDEQGRPIREDRYDGGTLQGRDDFPPGAAGPRIGGAARVAIDRLMRRAAEATRAAAAPPGG